MKNKSFYLSFTEFYLIASKIGIEMFFGFSDEQALKPSENEVILSINKMTRNKILNIGDDILLLNVELKDIFEQIKASEYCAVMYRANPILGVVCCYISHKTVLTDISEDGQKIRLRVMENSEIGDLLYDENFLFENVCEIEDEYFTGDGEMINYVKEREFKDEALKLCSMNDVNGVIDFFDKSNVQVCRCCFVGDTDPESLIIIEKGSCSSVFGKNRILSKISDLWRT